MTVSDSRAGDWADLGGCVRGVNPKRLLVMGTFPKEEIQKGKRELRLLVG